ncbi:hypothetical protein [Spirillospora sp. NBC_01491]|uniref:hypothetical protein n=1 Tax=Spirillospora sp. NBC_01491 TaxID=2976007 RepID=UPI002E334629|nr:hypothetical protein [Spirillospora sp. NBC_01491]
MSAPSAPSSATPNSVTCWPCSIATSVRTFAVAPGSVPESRSSVAAASQNPGRPAPPPTPSAAPAPPCLRAASCPAASTAALTCSDVMVRVTKPRTDAASASCSSVRARWSP